MENVYLIETKLRTYVVIHDIIAATFIVLDTEEINAPGFTLKDLKDVDISKGERYTGYTSIEDFLGIEKLELCETYGYKLKEWIIRWW